MTLPQAIQEGWGWMLDCPVEVLQINAFGNAILRDATGCYFRIIPEDVSCECIADSPESLTEVLKNPEFQSDWAMTDFLTRVETAHGPLAEHECYHFIIPSVLGGLYDESNVRKISLHECLSFAGDCARQIANMPDGTRVRLKVIHRDQRDTPAVT